MSGFWTAVAVAGAGGAGAAVRHLLDTGIPAGVRARFPWGIMLINLTGSFALGVLVGLALNHPIAAVAGSGFLGGYTTFSTASLDTVRLLAGRRTLAALLNGPGMLLLGVALSLVGIVAARSL